MTTILLGAVLMVSILRIILDIIILTLDMVGIWGSLGVVLGDILLTIRTGDTLLIGDIIDITLGTTILSTLLFMADTMAVDTITDTMEEVIILITTEDTIL